MGTSRTAAFWLPRLVMAAFTIALSASVLTACGGGTAPTDEPAPAESPAASPSP